jgi:hypothetical protein
VSKFTTKDSGKRAAFANGGVRDTNEGKLRLDLVMPKNVPFEDQLLVRWAELMRRGAEKYSDRNWEQFADEAAKERGKESALRHFMQWYFGFKDEDHGAAVLFNIGVHDYVEGVLEGRWEAAKPEDVEPVNELDESSFEPWHGTYADPEPPENVKLLRLVGSPWRDQNIERRGDKWAWTTSPEGSGWHWEQALIKEYEFEEVRDDTEGS